MKYKAYPKYKDSQVGWIGDVPESWSVQAIKRKTRVRRGASPRPIDDPIYFDDDGDFAWVRIADVTSSNKYLQETTQRLSDLGSSLSVKLQPGALFLSIAATVGKPCIAKIKCCIHDGFVYFPDYKENIAYLYYIFNCGEAYKGLGKWGTQLNLNTDTVGWIKVAFPSKEEQSSIVGFLDHETSRIDMLIAKKERQIELLHEKRSAIISHAVTKGLNPDARIKDSGIEWLGEIPEHWEILRLKYAANLINQKVGGRECILPYIGLEHIESWTGKRVNIEESSSDGQASIYKKGDVLFGKLRPYLAKVYASDANGICTGELLVLRPKSILQKFLRDYLLNPDFISIVNSSTYGAKMPRANWSFIGNLPILVPPIAEQDKIIKYIENETDRIDMLVDNVKHSINMLHEYRTTLITAAVTGKIDVRKEAA